MKIRRPKEGDGEGKEKEGNREGSRVRSKREKKGKRREECRAAQTDVSL